MKINLINSGKGKHSNGMRGDIGIKKSSKGERNTYAIYFNKDAAKAYDMEEGDMISFGTTDICNGNTIGFVNLTKEKLYDSYGPKAESLLNDKFVVRIQSAEGIRLLKWFTDNDVYREYKLFNKKGDRYIHKAGIFDENKVKTTEFFPSDFGQ